MIAFRGLVAFVFAAAVTGGAIVAIAADRPAKPAPAAANPAAKDAAAQLADKTIRKFIRPGYERLAQSAATLRDSAAAFCAKPDEQSRAKLNAAFEAALLDWSRIENIRFGPVALGNTHDRFAFWPDEKGIGLKQITAALAARDEALTKAETLRGKSVAVQGFTALEYLLYGTGNEMLLAGNAEGAYRWRFAAAVTDNIARMAEEVRRAWASEMGFAGTLLRPSASQALYKTSKDVKLELFKAFTVGLIGVRDMKLARMVGEDTASAQPKRGPYWRSGLTFKVISANLEALEDYFLQSGFAEVGRVTDPPMEKSLELDLKKTRSNINAFIALPVDIAVKMPANWNRLNTTIFELATLQRNSMAVGRAADLSLSFNSLDGD